MASSNSATNSVKPVLSWGTFNPVNRAKVTAVAVDMKVGGLDGTTVGDLLGTSDGHAFGEVLEVTLGSLDGNALRELLGVPDGNALGEVLDDTLGELLRDILGRLDGVSVGDPVDEEIGLDVGAEDSSVGGIVGTKQNDGDWDGDVLDGVLGDTLRRMEGNPVRVFLWLSDGDAVEEGLAEDEPAGDPLERSDGDMLWEVLGDML
jgi:hypothetical protein